MRRELWFNASESMKAEVISIGDELTSGQRLDTNGQWLSQRLAELGVRVLYHTTVGDDLAANVQVFQSAFERADLILCTGGLGPTADDLTRQAIADATGTELVQDDQALEHIKTLFCRRKREMPERNIVQALFPVGSHVVHNPHGSAPGIDMAITMGERVVSRIFALPGVPAEMREMWDATVASNVREMVGKRQVIRHYQIKCFGVGESDLEQMLPDLIRRGREPSVGITVSQATITLRISASAETPELCYQSMESTIQEIHDSLGDLIFGDGEDELQHEVVRQLLQRSETLSVVELGTGGLVSNWLSEADCGGVVYKGSSICRVEDADSLEELAKQCQRQFSSDYVLAFGPFPEIDLKAASPPSFTFGIFSSDGFVSNVTPFSGHPDILKSRAGKQGLDQLRLTLLQIARSS